MRLGELARWHFARWELVALTLVAVAGLAVGAADWALARVFLRTVRKG